jgi:hypothetical protein
MKKIVTMVAILFGMIFSVPTFAQDMMLTSSLVTTTMIVSGSLTDDSDSPKKKHETNVAKEEYKPLPKWQQNLNSFMTTLVGILALFFILFAVWMIICV